MEQQDRRRHRRISLRLPLEGRLGEAAAWTEGQATSNISVSGMYLRTDLAHRPEVGARVTFELVVPPGDGYSPTPGRVKGEGEVVRVDPLPEGSLGVAVQFTDVLNLDF